MIGRGHVMKGGGSGLGDLLRHQMPHSFIKSIQAGTITLNGVASNTATINSVNMAHSVLLFLGNDHTANGAAPDAHCCRLTFTNATTITLSRGSGATGNDIGSYVVIEFWPGVIRAVERGTITIANGSATGTATLSRTLQNTGKTWLVMLGMDTTSTSTTVSNQKFRISLTNATTVTATRGGTVNAHTVGFQVVEFL